MTRWREALRESNLYRPIWRRKLKNLTRETNRYPDWTDLLGGHQQNWNAAKKEARGPRIAIATSLGLHFASNTIDSLLATALTFRGAQVEFIYCDGLLPACQMLDYGFVPSQSRLSKRGAKADICDICFSAGRSCISPLGLKSHFLSAYVSEHDHEMAERFANESLETIERETVDPRIIHAKAGTLRFYGREKLCHDHRTLAMYRQYLIAAWRADQAARNIFASQDFDVVVAHHGVYVPQGLIANAANECGVRLVTWHPSYRQGRFIYQHADTYHRGMISEPASSWRDIPLTPKQDASLSAYLSSRETGSQDWITFQREAPQTRSEVYGSLGLHPQKDVYLLAANVAWDARLHYPESAFGTMFEWVSETIAWFCNNPQKQLIIRCHPGEVTNTPRAQDRLDLMIADRFHDLPDNIRVIPAEDPKNTYALADISKAILIYNTKMGMEMSARGKPVFVAGDAWIRGKGFSRDADSPEMFRRLLDDGEQTAPLTEFETNLARRYAYHFFFRRCIPFDILDPDVDWPLMKLKADVVDTIIHNSDDGLDVVCKGVMDGTPFEYTG